MSIPAYCNCEISEAPPLLGSQLVGPKGQVWHVRDEEQSAGPTSPSIAKAVFGPLANLQRLPFTPTPFDLIFVYCAPNAGESLDALRTRFSSYVDGLSEQYPQTPVGCVGYIRTNNVLSDLDIANGLQAVSELCAPTNRPLLFFRDYGSDVSQDAKDRAAYIRNGQPCPVQVFPPSSDSTAAIKLLMEK